MSKTRWVALICGLGMVIGLGAYLFSERTPATDQLEEEVAEVVEDGAVEEVEAQTTTSPGLSVEEERILRNVARDTRSADAARASKAQQVMTRSARTKLPGLAPTTIAKGGLLGVAAGVWIHNGVVLSNGLQCGQTECGDPVVLDAQFRQATKEADGGSGGVGGVSRAYDGDNNVKATVMLEALEMDYDRSARKVTVKTRWSGRWADDWLRKTGGTIHGEIVSGNGAFAYPYIPTNYSGRTLSPRTETTSDSPTYPLSEGTTQPFTEDWKYGVGAQNRQNFGSVVTGWTDYKWENPVYDWGATTIEADRLPTENDYVSSPEETKAFVDGIEADPEYDPAWAGHPWDDKPGEWHEIEPPNTDEGDERIFGPKTWENPRRDDAGQEYEQFEDGTFRLRDPNGEDVVYLNEDYTSGDARSIWRYNPPDGTPPTYDYMRNGQSRPGGVAVGCVDDGDSYPYRKTKYPDGITREMWFEPGTTTEQTHTAVPTCEVWKDQLGNTIPAPTDMDKYSLRPLKTPPGPPPA